MKILKIVIATILIFLTSSCLTRGDEYKYKEEYSSQNYSASTDQEGKEKLYEVMSTDTLVSIARRHHSTPLRIIELNHLKKPYSLKPGQLIRVPSFSENNNRPQSEIRISPKS